MARRTPDAHYEREPHLCGPRAHQYRYGTSVGSAEVPPRWGLAMAHDPTHPHFVDRFAKDVRDWVGVTEVSKHRQGQFLIWVSGGAARRLFEGMATHEKHS